ncbi:hypothetical protein ACVGVM_12640 [Pseudonocardia bannensis]|uniref:Uncharacterized protein n=1 Tax=Pseudonocardia bannensis TaxID=630973 RepID=A0A848DM28_9PSEU|nr:hypothetical protein [Pseudonocardia bannensis]NMH93593.1 hypothetical protein [Pseudonocardia bannensis]
MLTLLAAGLTWLIVSVVGAIVLGAVARIRNAQIPTPDRDDTAYSLHEPQVPRGQQPAARERSVSDTPELGIPAPRSGETTATGARRNWTDTGTDQGPRHPGRGSLDGS